MRELKSYIYRIYLTKKQKTKFDFLYFQNVFLFNKLLDEKEKRIATNDDEAIYVKDFIRQYKELDDGNFISFLSTYKMVNRIIEKAKTNDSAFFRKNFIKYPKKIHFDIPFFNIKLSKNHIFVPRLGEFKGRVHRMVPENSLILSAIIEENIKDNYFINFLVEKRIESVKVIPHNAIGLDYSSPHLFVSSENDLGDDFKVKNFNEKKISKIKKQLTRCKFESKNYYKLKEKEERFFDEVVRKRRFNLHLASLYCVKNFDVIGVETLDLEEIAHNKNLGKNTYSNSYDKLCKYLNYKALEKGKYFIKVPKYFPSSQICSQCGVLHDGITLDQRTFVCDCGLKINRDLNAAVNIREKALLMLKEKKRNKDYRKVL